MTLVKWYFPLYWNLVILGGANKTKVHFLMVPRWILLSLQYIRTGKKEFSNLASVLTLHIDPQNLKITIIESRIKVVVDPLSDLSKQAQERPMEKTRAQSDLPVWRKIPKSHQKYCFSEKWYFRVHWPSASLAHVLIGHSRAEGSTTTLIFDPIMGKSKK